MANLKSASVKVLGIRFGEEVDKRTVEKCLVAVGSMLGTNESDEKEEGAEDNEVENQWKGLEELKVSFKSASVGQCMPKSETGRSCRGGMGVQGSPTRPIDPSPH
jgi:hypothetical protein